MTLPPPSADGADSDRYAAFRRPGAEPSTPTSAAGPAADAWGRTAQDVWRDPARPAARGSAALEWAPASSTVPVGRAAEAASAGMPPAEAGAGRRRARSGSFPAVPERFAAPRTGPVSPWDRGGGPQSAWDAFDAPSAQPRTVVTTAARGRPDAARPDAENARRGRRVRERAPGDLLGTDGTATAALIVGVLALAFGLAPILGLAIGAIAVVLGVLALARRQSTGSAIAGIVLGLLGFALCLGITLHTDFGGADTPDGTPAAVGLVVAPSSSLG